MPVIITQGLAAIGALIIFASSLFGTHIQKPKIINHKETKSYTIFYCKAKEKEQPTQVIVDKNTGNVKLKFRNKRDNVEFDLEYSSELTPEDRANVNQIMRSVLEYTKKDKTVKQKVRNFIKDFVNRKF